MSDERPSLAIVQEGDEHVVVEAEPPTIHLGAINTRAEPLSERTKRNLWRVQIDEIHEYSEDTRGPLIVFMFIAAVAVVLFLVSFLG